MTGHQPQRFLSLFKPGSTADESDTARRAKIHEDIANRLRTACNYLSEGDFAALVDKITAVQLGGERRSR